MAAKTTESADHDKAQMEEVRDAVVFLAGPPEHLTIAAFWRRAGRAELRRLRRKHLDGGPFPPRSEDPKPGRRVGR